MNKLDIKKVGFLFILIGVMLLIISISMICAENKMISKSKAILDKATIIYSGKISGEVEYSNTGARMLMEYKKKIVYRYIDYLGNPHEKTEIYSSIDYKKISEKYLQGEIIEITYNKDNPDISIIGKRNSYIFPQNFSFSIIHLMAYGFIGVGIYFAIQKKYKYIENNKSNNNITYNNNDIEFGINMCSIIVLLSMLILSLYFKRYLITIICSLILLIQQVKNYIYNTKHKTFCLEVVNIKYIDYEREKVIFKDDNGIFYHYFTDFGEDFENGQKYKVTIKMKNLRKEKAIDNEYLIIYNIINMETNKFSRI